jgi:hypothetical protein
LTYVRAEPPVEKVLESFATAFMPGEPKSLIDQLLFVGIKLTVRGISQPGAELGDDPPHAVTIAQSLESRPETFERTGGRPELVVLAEPFLDLIQGELWAGVRTADGGGEGVMPSPPIADGGSSYPRDARDLGECHHDRALAHEYQALPEISPLRSPDLGKALLTQFSSYPPVGVVTRKLARVF